ncbi:hypothetical protein BC829DRAFT_30927 [Chytridium lagenaria]|nr:hypothetical protein BC829DRAFT_30927 [Chytridium lagenaria]
MLRLHEYPEILRLSLCAYCAHFSRPPAPEAVSKTYFAAARSLAHTSVDIPSLESLQSLVVILQTAFALGDVAASTAFADMAFRMASLLGLDTPELLFTKVLTDSSMELRDALWRALIFTDNVMIATVRSLFLPRFFNHGIDSESFLRIASFLPVDRNDTSHRAIIHHLVSLTYVTYKLHTTIAETVQALQHQAHGNALTTLTREKQDFWDTILSARHMLETWKLTLPPCFALDDIGPRDEPLSNSYFMTVLLGYHGMLCLIGQASRVLQLYGVCRRQPPAFTLQTIEDSATASSIAIAAIAKRGVETGAREFELHVYMAISMFASGRFIYSGLRSEGRRENLERLSCIRAFMKMLCKMWRGVEYGFQQFENEVLEGLHNR